MRIDLQTKPRINEMEEWKYAWKPLSELICKSLITKQKYERKSKREKYVSKTMLQYVREND